MREPPPHLQQTGPLCLALGGLVHGEGAFASVAWWRPVTVQLHETVEGAEAAKTFIDKVACGHTCGRDHAVIQVVLPDRG